MWIFTTAGFLSAVEHRDDANLLIVRARHRDDIVALCDELGCKPIEGGGHDYQFRAFVPKKAFAAWLRQQAARIDYPNFKDAVAERQGTDRAALYGQLWAALQSLAALPERRSPRRRSQDVALIKRGFDERFATWDITLPEDAVHGRRDGHIFTRGWHIGYVWGEQDGEEYLDVLSQHRHSGDAIDRYFASGRVERLEAPSTVMLVPDDPADRERAEREFFERNRRIVADLRERGLLPPAGQGLLASEINEYLATGGAVGAQGQAGPRSTKAQRDAALRLTVQHAATAIEHHPDRDSFLERLLERGLMAAWSAAVPGGATAPEVMLAVPGWNPEPGRTDLMLAMPDDPSPSIAAELKIYNVEETLWDLLKLVSIVEDDPVVERTYLVVATTPQRWRNAEVAALYALPGSEAPDGAREWDVRAMLREWKKSWAYLLTGGSGRPRHAPARVRTIFVAAHPVSAFPDYELRCIAVEPVSGGERVRFNAEGWPLPGA